MLVLGPDTVGDGSPARLHLRIWHYLRGGTAEFGGSVKRGSPTCVISLITALKYGLLCASETGKCIVFGGVPLPVFAVLTVGGNQAVVLSGRIRTWPL
jgi:hypothetical protein